MQRVGVSAASSEARSAELPGLRITDVRYRPRFRTPVHEHEHDCVTVALGGGLAKELRGRERTFRAAHGVSVGAYLRRLRVEWAAEALLADDVSLAGIAARAGFADQSHFTRTFLSHFGLPPGRWRAARRRTS